MTNVSFIQLLFILIAYFIGSISSAILVCKIMRLPDPRTQGSKNPGATNVLRIGGKAPAIIALVGDIFKAVLPLLAAKCYGLPSSALCAIALAVFLGHLFPIYYRFKGGKGVATAFGCLVTLVWPLGLLVLSTWLIVAVITRYSSLSALIAALTAPFYCWFLTNQWDYTLTTACMSALLIYTHRNNIKKLWEGSESRIGAS